MEERNEVVTREDQRLPAEASQRMAVLPPVDIFEDDTGITLFADLPGVSKDKLGVRIKDNDSAARREFTGLKWYPPDPSWRVQAKFVPWDKPHAVTFDTAVGVKETDESPGYVTFQRDGKEYRLEPVVDDNELWFVMRDQTSGKTTYGASRFLYAAMPKDGVKRAGTVEIDFNRAENPPCVFTDFATCPLPPPQNRLPLAVTAGEQMYGKQH